MRVTEFDRPLDVVFICSFTVAGNKLVGNKGYPGIVDDFRSTFARLRGLRADVVLSPHPEQADVIGRAQRRETGDSAAFIDATLLPRLVEQAAEAFEVALKRERGQ